MPPPKIAVVTLYTPEVAELGTITAENKRAYAEKHGYDCIIGTHSLDTTRHPSWSKIPLMLNAMSNGYDWLFWTDSDSIITNYEIPLTKWIDDNYDIIWCRDHPEGRVRTDVSDCVNAGVMLIRCCEASKTFLHTVWTQTQFVNHKWLEQEAINQLLHNKYPIKYRILNPKEFNSFAPETIEVWDVHDAQREALCRWTHGDFICHMPGVPGHKRVGVAKSHLPTYTHGGDTGDVIYSLPIIKMRGGGKLRLAKTHWRVREPFTQQKVNSLRPFLEDQAYITSVEYGDQTQAGDVDMNEFRRKLHLYDPKNNLCDTQLLCAGLSVADSTNITSTPYVTPWLTCSSPNKAARVIISRSSRYHGDFNWKDVQRKYRDEAIFVGLPQEYEDWQSNFGPIKYYPTASFWELYRTIAGAELFIGNQSCPMAMAIGLGVPQIVQEVFTPVANCKFNRPGILYDSSILP